MDGVLVASSMHQRSGLVAGAGASGSMAAAAVVQSLLADEFGLPVSPWPIEKEDADAPA